MRFSMRCLLLGTTTGWFDRRSGSGCGAVTAGARRRAGSSPGSNRRGRLSRSPNSRGFAGCLGWSPSMPRDVASRIRLRSSGFSRSRPVQARSWHCAPRRVRGSSGRQLVRSRVVSRQDQSNELTRSRGRWRARCPECSIEAAGCLWTESTVRPAPLRHPGDGAGLTGSRSSNRVYRRTTTPRR